ncbi:MAG: hypothetical protein WDN69_05005 [Aliidongia sp.]
MPKLYLGGASILALGAAIVTAHAGPPTAPRVVTVNVADYNAAQVTTAGAILTVPAGLASYNLNAGGGTLELNSRFTVTLPPNFSFSSQPSLSDTGTTSFMLITGGVGSQSATFQIETAPLVPGQQATLNSFAISGATVLEAPIPVVNALPLTLQATNNAEITNNDASPFSKGAFASEPGVTAIFVGAIQFIDLSSPTLGTLFLSSPDTPTAVIGATAIQAETVDAATSSVPVLSPDGGLNSLSTSDTATLTIGGIFNGIKTPFVSTTSDCQSPISTGTVPVSQASFPDIPINREEFLCFTATGTSLLSENVQRLPKCRRYTGHEHRFSRYQWDRRISRLHPLHRRRCDRGHQLLTGDDSGYSSLLRVNNAGAGTVDLFALVQPDTGGAPLTGSLGSLGAGTGTVFTEPQIAAAVTGLDLANSGQRATIQLIISGDFGNVAASSFLVNPGGVVTNVGLEHNTPP